MQNLKEKFVRLLRWSEKYTKTDMVYLAKGGGWLSASQSVSALSSFLLAIVFANLLPKETYGSYRFILSAAGVLSIPTLQGMNPALIRAVAQKARGTVRIALQTRLSWSLFASLAALGVAAYYYFIDPYPDLSISFLVVASFLPFMESFLVYDAVFQGEQRFRRSGLLNALATVVASLVMAGTLLVTDHLPTIALAYFLPWTVMRYVFLRMTLRSIAKDERSDTSAIPYGKHLTLMSTLGIITAHIDKVLLFFFLGPVQVAVYSIAIAPLEQMKGFLKNIYVLAFPKFSVQSSEELATHILGKTTRFFFFLLAIVILYILLAPFLLPLLFPAYSESVGLSQLYAISIAATASLLPVGALQAQGRTRDLYTYNVIVHISQILLLIVGTIWYGLLGVVAARIIGRFLQLGVATVLVRRKDI